MCPLTNPEIIHQINYSNASSQFDGYTKATQVSEIGNLILQQAQAPSKSMCMTGPFMEVKNSRYGQMAKGITKSI